MNSARTRLVATIVILTALAWLAVAPVAMAADGGVVIWTGAFQQTCNCWGTEITFTCHIWVISDEDGGIHVVNNCQCPTGCH